MTMRINFAGIGRRYLEVERAMGIEPTAQAWEAWVLPLYDARDPLDSRHYGPGRQISDETLSATTVEVVSSEDTRAREPG